MTNAASALAITQLLTRVLAQDRGRLLSALVARLRDFQLAEDALQEASISALTHWGRVGLPASPQGWLLKVAFRKAIDRLRSGNRANQNAADMLILAEEEAVQPEPQSIPDERLRLIFTCCHPALEPKSQIALTLRTLCGLTTPQIAAAFLDNDTTMGQRITRAKTKIAAAGIPFAVPEAESLPERLNAVLTVVYLVFTTGYAQGPIMGRDLCDEAMFLAHMLNDLHPNAAEVEGLLALVQLTHARRKARTDAQGKTTSITNQDRSLWDTAMIANGLNLIEIALQRHALGPFQIKAAIAACHVKGPVPDWPQIAALYALLLQYEPTDVIRLNHAVAVAEAQGPQAAQNLLTPLAQTLQDYQPFHAAKADILARLGAYTESRQSYLRAIDLADHPADAAFLTEKLKNLPA
jgi:RNA polymerase sigma factor (sigma-70 family)